MVLKALLSPFLPSGVDSPDLVWEFVFVLGVGGFDGDGDITKPDNLLEFKDYVLSCTENQGVHFVMADGVSFV